MVVTRDQLERIIESAGDKELPPPKIKPRRFKKREVAMTAEEQDAFREGLAQRIRDQRFVSDAKEIGIDVPAARMKQHVMSQDPSTVQTAVQTAQMKQANAVIGLIEKIKKEMIAEGMPEDLASKTAASMVESWDPFPPSELTRTSSSYSMTKIPAPSMIEVTEPEKPSRVVETTMARPKPDWASYTTAEPLPSGWRTYKGKEPSVVPEPDDMDSDDESQYLPPHVRPASTMSTTVAMDPVPVDDFSLGKWDKVAERIARANNILRDRDGREYEATVPHTIHNQAQTRNELYRLYKQLTGETLKRGEINERNLTGLRSVSK